MRRWQKPGRGALAVAAVAALAALVAAGALPAGGAPADSLSRAAPSVAPGAHAADAAQAHAFHVNEATQHSRFADIEEWLHVWDDPQPDT